MHNIKIITNSNECYRFHDVRNVKEAQNLSGPKLLTFDSKEGHHSFIILNLVSYHFFT